MRVIVIALNTFMGLLRNRLIVLFCAGFLCLLLLSIAPLSTIRHAGPMQGAGQMESLLLGFVGLVISMANGFGSLLATWMAADAVAGEIRARTILAVLARPIHRWQFLFGKYLGIQLLMSIFTVFLLSLSYVLAWIGGERIHTAAWLLIAYPMVRYTLYSTIGMLLGTVFLPAVSFGVTLVITVLSWMVAPGSASSLPVWLANALYAVLPSFGLFSEQRFLTITGESLTPIPWSEHAVVLTYGLNYAFICFLIAAMLFRSRNVAATS